MALAGSTHPGLRWTPESLQDPTQGEAQRSGPCGQQEVQQHLETPTAASATPVKTGKDGLTGDGLMHTGQC